MWGLIPAAGAGSRIQPLAFSKELLPVGSHRDEQGVERPRAVSEYLVERMIRGGATRICFVVSPGKSDILEYYGAALGPAHIAYVVQPEPAGLCDALFRALPLIAPRDPLLIGLPDTIWFPDDGFRALPDQRLSLLLFPVQRPELFDAVVTDEHGRVLEVQVKHPEAGSPWIWGALRMTGAQLANLYDLWIHRGRRDVYFGTLINAWLAVGGTAWGVRAGASYVDVGTLHGYREAIRLLDSRSAGRGAPVPQAVAAGRRAAGGAPRLNGNEPNRLSRERT